MDIGIGFFVTVLVLAILLGVVARFALAGNQDILEGTRGDGDSVRQIGHDTTRETTNTDQESGPHFHAL